MSVAEAEALSLYSLVTRHWPLGIAVEACTFDAAEKVVAFSLADGDVSIAQASDPEPSSKRWRVAADDGRSTISPRRKPFPPVMRLSIDAPPVRLAPFGPGGFLAGGAGGRLVHIAGDGVVEPFAGADGGPITAIAAARGGAALVLTGSEVRLHQPDRDPRLIARGGDGTALAVAPAGDCFALADGPVTSIRGTEAGDIIASFDLGAVATLSFSPDGRHLAAALVEGGIALVALDSGRVTRHGNYPAAVRSLAWSADSKLLATDGAFRIIVWSVGASDTPDDLAGNVETGRGGLVAIASVAINPRRPLVAAGYENGLIVVAQIGGRDELLVKPPGEGAVLNMRWSADGLLLAFGCAGGTAGIVGFPSQLFK